MQVTQPPLSNGIVTSTFLGLTIRFLLLRGNGTLRWGLIPMSNGAQGVPTGPIP
jgi:hypothetical protein